MEGIDNNSSNISLNPIAGTSEMVDDGETTGYFSSFVNYFTKF